MSNYFDERFKVFCGEWVVVKLMVVVGVMVVLVVLEVLEGVVVGEAGGNGVVFGQQVLQKKNPDLNQTRAVRNVF